MKILIPQTLGVVSRSGKGFGRGADEEVVIDQALARRDLLLRRHERFRSGGRLRIGHFQESGDPARGGRARSGRQILLPLHAGVAEMHLRIDGAGDEEKPPGVDYLGPRGGERGSHLMDKPVNDKDIGLGRALRKDGSRVLDEQGSVHPTTVAKAWATANPIPNL
jgi:hypothetical protein